MPQNFPTVEDATLILLDQPLLLKVFAASSA